MTRKPRKLPKLGASGDFPEGKLNEDDEGALEFAVARDPETGLVHINFGTPVAWLALPPEVAIEFGEALIKKAKG